MALKELLNFGPWESFFLWSFIWIIALIAPPGSKAISTAYRFHSIHGVICCTAAFMCLEGYLPETFTAMITISYFIIDFINNLINDFYFKVKSYQTPSQRRVEYFHHIFCCGVGISCELYYRACCDFERNPFIRLMFAELSTPFLMLWRVYPDNNIIGIIFLLVFIGNRLIYHGLYCVPDFIRSCNLFVAYGFGVPYCGMNLFFFFMISRKLMKNIFGSRKQKKQ